jgi:hypothetical protein
VRLVIRDVVGERGRVGRSRGNLPAGSIGPESLNRAAGELTTLAERGASGALEIVGYPSGVIYLSEGCVTFAESAAVPDIASRVIRSGYLDDTAWAELAGSGAPREDLASLLVRRGVIGAGELRVLLQSVTLEAVVALTLPATKPAGLRTWFLPGQAHWAAAMLYLDVASVLNHARGTGRRLAAPQHAACPQAALQAPRPHVPRRSHQVPEPAFRTPDRQAVDRPESDWPETDWPETDWPETDWPETDWPALDRRALDRPARHGHVPDQLVADGRAPGRPVPDERAPDQPAPDRLAPDQPPLDEPAPAPPADTDTDTDSDTHADPLTTDTHADPLTTDTHADPLTTDPLTTDPLTTLPRRMRQARWTAAESGPAAADVTGAVRGSFPYGPPSEAVQVGFSRPGIGVLERVIRGLERLD